MSTCHLLPKKIVFCAVSIIGIASAILWIIPGISNKKMTGKELHGLDALLSDTKKSLEKVNMLIQHILSR